MQSGDNVETGEHYSGGHYWNYPVPWHDRLLHSPRLVAVGLSVGYEIWPHIGWYADSVISWSIDWETSQLHWILGDYGMKLLVGISIIFEMPQTVPLHSPDGRMPAIMAVQGDCERVYWYEVKSVQLIRQATGLDA